MQELKMYIKKNKYHGLHKDISKYLKLDGKTLTPEGVAVNLQLDYESTRADVVDAAMRLIAKHEGHEELYRLSAAYIMQELNKTK